MNLRNIINKIFYLLPVELRTNKNFIRMNQLFLNNVYDTDNYEIEVGNNIYDSINIRNKNIITNGKYNRRLIFSFECKDSSYIRFTIYRINDKGDNEYAICFRRVNEENLIDDKNVELCIKKDKAKWRYIFTLIDNYSYYYDYDYKVFECDNDLNVIDNDYDKELNDHFTSIFYTPLQETPKYRLNFSKYREIINKYRINNSMKSIDEFFLRDDNGIEFDGALNFDIFKDVILNADSDGTIDEKLYYQDDEDVDDEDIDASLFDDERFNFLNSFMEPFDDDKSDDDIDVNKLICIEDNLINQIGGNSEFIISHNIIVNMYSYLTNVTRNILKTVGILVKKVNDKYTLYYICIEPNRIIAIPKKMSNSQIKSFYKEMVANSDATRIKEFFGIDNNMGRYLK